MTEATLNIITKGNERNNALISQFVSTEAALNTLVATIAHSEGQEVIEAVAQGWQVDKEALEAKLKALGIRRATAEECKAYLQQFPNIDQRRKVAPVVNSGGAFVQFAQSKVKVEQPKKAKKARK